MHQFEDIPNLAKKKKPMEQSKLNTELSFPDILINFELLLNHINQVRKIHLYFELLIQL